MPIDASSDPYEVSRAGDPLGAKAGGDVLKGAAAQEEDEDDFDDGGSVGGKGGLGSALDERTDAEEEVDDPAGVATSKVDFTEIDEDLESAGTGARTADLDLQGIEKSSPGDALDDVDDLDAAGTGSGGKSALLGDEIDDDLDAGDDSFVKSSVFDDDIDDLDSLRSAVDPDDELDEPGLDKDFDADDDLDGGDDADDADDDGLFDLF